MKDRYRGSLLTNTDESRLLRQPVPLQFFIKRIIEQIIGGKELWVHSIPVELYPLSAESIRRSQLFFCNEVDVVNKSFIIKRD